MMDQQNLNYGRDQNVINQPGTVIINVPDPSSIELQEVPPARRIINYIGALIFLVFTLCWWFLLGLFAKREFPFKWISNLLFAVFQGEKKGLEGLLEEIGYQCRDKINLNRQDLEINGTDRREYNRLSKQESEVWLLKNLIEILTSGSNSRNQEIDKVLELLQKQQDKFSLHLKQLDKRFDPDLEKFQKFWIRIIEGQSHIEIDYKKINQILNSLVYKFTLTAKPSQQEAKDLLDELRQIIINNPHNIDMSRLETLHNVFQLLKWLAATGYSEPFEYEFKVEVDSARKRKAMELIVEQIVEVLKETIANVSTETLDSVGLGIKSQWIAEILVYGVNNRGLAVVELVLEIDWSKFNNWRNYSTSDGTVKITWGGKVATEINRTMSRFNNFLQRNSLTSDWRVSYSPGLDEEEIDKILGFRNSPIYWDEHGIEAPDEKLRIQDLAELGIGLYFKPRNK